jgi:hypothetical protein
MQAERKLDLQKGFQLLELNGQRITYEAHVLRAGFTYSVAIPKQWTRLMNIKHRDIVKVTVERMEK